MWASYTTVDGDVFWIDLAQKKLIGDDGLDLPLLQRHNIKQKRTPYFDGRDSEGVKRKYYYAKKDSDIREYTE
jgi:hypothetical protein